MTLQFKTVLGAAALVVLLVAGLLLANASLRARLAEERAQTVALRAGNENLKEAIARQNAALEAMREDSEARARKAEALIAEGRRRAEALRRGAERLARSTPSGADDCAEARQLMIGYAEARAKDAGWTQGRLR